MKYVGWVGCGLVFPNLLGALEQQYGFRGVLLVAGALVAHMTAFALLLKVPPGIKNNESQNGVRHKADTTLPNCEASHVPSDDSSKCLQPFSDILVLLRVPMAYVVVACCIITDYTYSSFVRSILDYASDKGIPLSETNNLIVYASVAQIVGPILIPVLSDLKLLRRSTLEMIIFFLLGVLLLAYPETHSYLSYLLLSVGIGMLLGGALPMKIVLMADFLGVDNVSNCHTIVGIVYVPILLCNPSIVGKYVSQEGLR